MLDDVPILFDCPDTVCPGEIRATFGRLKADPRVTCPVCGIGTDVEFSEEYLEAVRAALAGLEAPEVEGSGIIDWDEPDLRF